MKAIRAALIAAALLAGTAAGARADLVSETSFTLPAGGGPVDFAPFDPTLGTLDSVSIAIAGEFDIIVTPPPNIVDGLPAPYPVTVSFGQRFTAVGAGGFTTTLDNRSITGVGVSDGTGAPIGVLEPFDYSFAFNSATDLLGFALASDGSTEGATVDGFLPQPGFTSIDELLVDEATSDGNSVVNVVADGIGTVTYDYTPASPGGGSGPSRVPEPPSLALLGPAIFAALRGRRKRV
jgi:hypothetical protein